MLPDDVLLKIFDFYVIQVEDFRPLDRQSIEGWQLLAHVCQRWRNVIFQSPRRLNLQLLCTHKTSARNIVDIWPPLRLIICDINGIFDDEVSSMDNIIAALEHNDRVRQIDLGHLTSSQLGCVTDSAAMLKAFPELTDLRLGPVLYGGLESILPESFLGGTAPRLRSLIFSGVPFPRLPKLLLSATHLVDLYLSGIPRSGYIPPEAMAISLSSLTSLESLRLHFLYPRPRPAENRRPPLPPLTRSILPSLTKIRFKGASEYLEVILAWIDAPRLNEMHITFFNQIIFDTPQLFQFISRTPTLRALDKAYIAFNSEAVIVKFPSQTSEYGVLNVEIPCTASEWQLSSLVQICTSSLPPFFTLEDLYIFDDLIHPPRWQDDVDNTLWLDLLLSFASVKNFYLCEKFVPRVAPALQELVRARATEALPTLENIFLEGLQPSGPLQQGIEQFVVARRLTNHPVAVSRWDRNPERYMYRYYAL